MFNDTNRIWELNRRLIEIEIAHRTHDDCDGCVVAGVKLQHLPR